MYKNYRVLLGLHFIAFAVIILGVLFKILHWNGANAWLICGFVPEAILVGYVVFLILNDQSIKRYKILWIFSIFTGSGLTTFIYLFYKIRQTRLGNIAQ
jgi:hypothetical protein